MVDRAGSGRSTGVAGGVSGSRVARRQLEEHRAPQQARPIPRDRDDRLFEALDAWRRTTRSSWPPIEAYERWRATARDRRGPGAERQQHKPLSRRSCRRARSTSLIPDSRVMRTQGTPPRQAYNAQAAVNDRQIILAAEITIAAADFGHLGPMLDTTLAGLDAQGVDRAPGGGAR